MSIFQYIVALRIRWNGGRPCRSYGDYLSSLNDKDPFGIGCPETVMICAPTNACGRSCAEAATTQNSSTAITAETLFILVSILLREMGDRICDTIPARILEQLDLDPAVE
jgi:hypothetical protein